MHISSRERAVIWSCVFIALLASLAGSLWNLYERIWWFDEVLHTFTAFTLTLLLAVFLYGAVLQGARTRPILFVLTVAGLGLAVGALWEIAEWTYDQLVAGNAILGKRDTIIDMGVDAIGAVIAGVVSLGIIKRQQ